MERTLSAYKDDWYYDIGANIAFDSIMYLIMLMFSQVAPLITPFGMTLFMIKYYICKYNVSYVYPTEFIGEGRVYKMILTFQYFAIVFSQMIVYGIFTINGNKYWYMCAAIAVFQIIAVQIYQFVRRCLCHSKAHKE